MSKEERAVHTGILYHANLAVLAEQAGNFEVAAREWRLASLASPQLSSIVLYEEAAKRCERKTRVGKRVEVSA